MERRAMRVTQMLTKRGVDRALIRDGTNVLAITVHLSKPDLRWVLNIDARLAALTGEDNRFLAGPLVCGTYQDKAVVSLDVRLPSTVVLGYGRAGGPTDRWVASARAATMHNLEIADLKPDTVYSYDVRVTREGGEEAIEYMGGRFRTAPAGPREFAFGVWGDCRDNPENWGKVAGRIKSDDALEFTIGLGDFVGHGEVYEEWEEQFFGPGQDLFATKPVWPVQGNHDDESDYFHALFPSTGGGKAFSFTYGDARFVCIEVPPRSCKPDGNVYESIEENLRQAKEKYIFVLSHYPMASSGYHGEGTGPKQIQEWLVPLFEKHRITAYFGAHTHFYERSEKDGIAYFVSGNAGVGNYGIQEGLNPFSKFVTRAYHYCRVRVTPEKAILEAVSEMRALPVTHPSQEYDIKESGKVFDRHEMRPRRVGAP
jgi:hypothetical protein